MIRQDTHTSNPSIYKHKYKHKHKYKCKYKHKYKHKYKRKYKRKNKYIQTQIFIHDDTNDGNCDRDDGEAKAGCDCALLMRNSKVSETREEFSILPPTNTPDCHLHQTGKRLLWRIFVQVPSTVSVLKVDHLCLTHFYVNSLSTWIVSKLFIFSQNFFCFKKPKAGLYLRISLSCIYFSQHTMERRQSMGVCL